MVDHGRIDGRPVDDDVCGRREGLGVSRPGGEDAEARRRDEAGDRDPPG